MATSLLRKRPQRCLRSRPHRAVRAAARADWLETGAVLRGYASRADGRRVDDFCRAVSLPAMAADSIARLHAGDPRRPEFSETRDRLQGHHPDPGRRTALPRIDRRFPRTLPRPADRQDRRHRCARISFRLGRGLRAGRWVRSNPQEREAAFQDRERGLFARVRRRRNGDACRQHRARAKRLC